MTESFGMSEIIRSAEDNKDQVCEQGWQKLSIQELSHRLSLLLERF